MMKSGKFGIAVVLSLALGLAILTTGAFAQGASQRSNQGKISISAHVAAMKGVMPGAASVILNSALQRPNGASNSCGNRGWGNGCGDCREGSHCFRPHLLMHCASERICHTVQVCHRDHWGRVCRGERVCRFCSICRRSFDQGWNGGWGRNRAWEVKHR